MPNLTLEAVSEVAKSIYQVQIEWFDSMLKDLEASHE